MTARQDQAEGLLIQQYKNSPNLIGFIRALASAFDPLDKAFSDLMLKRFIDSAEGVNLDVIGRIVVIERPYLDETIDDVFTLSDVTEIPDPSEPLSYLYDELRGCSSLARPDIGGRLTSVTPSSFVLADDPIYRRYIKAKVIRNNADGTLPTMIKYFDFVFDTTVTLGDRVGFIDIVIGRPLSVRERELVGKGLPRAGGIGVGIIGFAIASRPFGYAGNVNNSGYGDANASSQEGGGYASVLL